MEQNCARGRVAKAIVISGLAAMAGGYANGLGAVPAVPRQAGTSSAPAFEETIGTLAADLTIRQGRVTADGKPTGIDPPGYTLRLQRERNGTTWRTALSLHRLDAAAVQSLTGPQALDNPFVISRLEYDDDGTPPRMYDARGRLMAGPSENDRRRLGVPQDKRDPNWDPSAILGRIGGPPRGSDKRSFSAGLLVSLAERTKRRADLEQRFGPRAGQVRGLDQFIRRDGAQMHELLVAADSLLPIEMNVTEGGQLVSRARFEYEPRDADILIRRRSRAETIIRGSGGERSITDLVVSNLVIAPRGAR